jgi:signal transduction histidine kinase
MSEHIQQLQQLQMAGYLAGGIGHELNNQLTVILGSLEMALDQLPAGFEAGDALEHAKAAASRCADLSRHLVSVSRDRRSDMTKMDIAASVIEARKLLEYIKPAKIRVSTETEIGLFITGNQNQIRQALLELGTNAFSAMEEGGDLEFRAYRHEDIINVAVRDTGCGMTPSAQRRIFESLYVSGLATVQRIVAGHDGLFGLESRIGEGTVFLMGFPAWQPEPEPEVTSLQ